MSSSELLTEDKWINDGTNNIKCKAGTYVYYDDNKKISECTLASAYQGFLGYAWYRGSVVKFNNSNVSEIIPVKDTEAFDFVIKKGTTLSVVGDNIYATIAQDVNQNGLEFAKDNEIIFIKSSHYIIKGRLIGLLKQDNIMFCSWIIRGTDGFVTQGYLAKDTTIAEGVVFKAHTYVELNNKNIISGCLRDTAVINGIECVKNRYHLFYNDGTTLKVKLATINNLDYSAIEYDENGKVVKKYSDINYVKIDGYVFYQKGFTRPYELGYTTYKGTLAISRSDTYEGGGSITAPKGCEVIVRKSNVTGEVTREFIPSVTPFVVNGTPIPLGSKITENVTEGTSSVVLGRSITFGTMTIPAGTTLTYRQWGQGPVELVLQEDIIVGDGYWFPKGSTIAVTATTITGVPVVPVILSGNVFSSISSVTLQLTTTGGYKLSKITSPAKETIGFQTYPKGTIYEPDSQMTYVARISNPNESAFGMSSAAFESAAFGFNVELGSSTIYRKVDLTKGIELNKYKKVIACYGNSVRIWSGSTDFLYTDSTYLSYNEEWDTWLGDLYLKSGLNKHDIGGNGCYAVVPNKVRMQPMRFFKFKCLCLLGASLFTENSIWRKWFFNAKFPDPRYELSNGDAPKWITLGEYQVGSEILPAGSLFAVATSAAQDGVVSGTRVSGDLSSLVSFTATLN